MASNHLLGPFRGMNNRLPDERLSVRRRSTEPTPDLVRNIVNADVTDAGTVRRREGVTREVQGTQCRNLWAEGDRGFYVDDGALYAFPRTLIDPGPIAAEVSYCRVGDDVVWSDGRVLRRIVGSVSLPMTQPDVNPQPVVQVGADGSLPAGDYLVAFVAVGPSGDSAPTWPVQVRVPEGGRIEISGMVGSLKVYLSGPGGEELFLAGMSVSATASLAFQATGPMLMTRSMRPMPPGNIVRYSKGRLLVAAGNMLMYSEPFAPGLHNPARGYIPFPGQITIVEPVQGGVYVCADRTYLLAGDNIESAEVVEKLPYGAVPGTATRSETEEAVWWYSARGTVRATAEGEVTNVQEADIAAHTAVAGASLYREQEGMRRVMTSLYGADMPVGVATSFMEAEVIRKERLQ